MCPTEITVFALIKKDIFKQSEHQLVLGWIHLEKLIAGKAFLFAREHASVNALVFPQALWTALRLAKLAL